MSKKIITGYKVVCEKCHRDKVKWKSPWHVYVDNGDWDYEEYPSVEIWTCATCHMLTVIGPDNDS